MKVDFDDFGTGWYGISVGLNTGDIDRLIELLGLLRSGDLDHFHAFSREFENQDRGIADIEFRKLSIDKAPNMELSA